MGVRDEDCRGFRRVVEPRTEQVSKYCVQNFTPLYYYAASSGDLLRTFPVNLTVPLQRSCPLKTGPIG